MTEIIPLEDVEAQANAIAVAIINMPDTEPAYEKYRLHGIDWAWDTALSIVESGPQNDIERSIVAFAVQRRLEGK